MCVCLCWYSVCVCVFVLVQYVCVCLCWYSVCVCVFVCVRNRGGGLPVKMYSEHVSLFMCVLVFEKGEMFVSTYRKCLCVCSSPTQGEEWR